MKIVCFTYDDMDNPWCGGGGAYRILEIYKILAKKHEIICYTGNYPSAINHISHGIQFKRLGVGSHHLISRITFCILGNLYGAFIKADVIVSVFTVFAPVFCFLFARRKTVTEFYHYWGRQLFDKYGIAGLLPFLAERIVLYGSRCYITISPSIDRIIRTFGGPKEVNTILSGFDPALLQLEKTGEAYMLFIGRMDWYMKGLDILLSAFELMISEGERFKAIIAGKATRKQAAFVMEQVQQRNLDAYVEIRTNIDNNEKIELLASARLFCVASRFEGWCIAAIEAAACMIPVVGTNISGLKDSVIHQKTGFLVERENINQLKERIIQLHHDENLRTLMGAEGRHWANNFQWQVAANRYEDFLEKLLDE